jgi:transcriptional regulator with XRE-family HTH domain
VSYFYSEFGVKLKRAREQAGLTQKQLADRAELPRTSITNIEAGNQRIALHQLVLFADALGTAPLKLLPDREVDLEELVSEGDRQKLPVEEAHRLFMASVLRDNAPVRKTRDGEGG